MKVKDIMTQKVVVVSPETNIVEVAEILLTNRFHSVPVTEKNKVVGILTENDFFDKKSGQMYLPTYIRALEDESHHHDLSSDKKQELEKLRGMKAKDIMTPGCVTINPEMQLSQLVDTFKKTNFHSFAVTDKNNDLCGIVTLFDVIALIRI